MKKAIYLNIVMSLIYQACQVISGLIIPRLILQYFGSGVNGLLSSITQFSSYVTLLEGGVAGVMMANLHKPLLEGDIAKLSCIMVTIKGFYKNISFIIAIYQIALAVVLPFVIDGFSWFYIFSLTVILGVNLFFEYNITIPYELLINANNQIYYTNIVMAAVNILNTVVTFICLHIFHDIHIVKLCSAVVFLIQPITFKLYIDRHFQLERGVKKDGDVLAQRWDGFWINIAAFIHGNTDVAVLTLFLGVYVVSVYTTYNFVIAGVKLIINAVIASFVPALGRKIVSGDHAALSSFFDKYEYIVMSIVFFLFTIETALIVPFVMVYTKGVMDADYYQPYFAIVLSIAEVFYCIRTPYVEYAYQSKGFREISKYAYIEAILNIVISIVLVKKFGMIGVAVGTLISMVYRLFRQVAYSNEKMGRGMGIFLKYIAVYGSMYCFINFVIRRISLYYKFTVISFIEIALIVCILTFVCYAVVSLIFFRMQFYDILSKVFRK